MLSPFEISTKRPLLEVVSVKLNRVNSSTYEGRPQTSGLSREQTRYTLNDMRNIEGGHCPCFTTRRKYNIGS